MLEKLQGSKLLRLLTASAVNGSVMAPHLAACPRWQRSHACCAVFQVLLFAAMAATVATTVFMEQVQTCIHKAHRRF